MTQPLGIPADGMLRVSYVTVLTNPAAPKLTELNAGTSVDLSCYLTGDGWSVGMDQNMVSDRRLCTAAEYELIGTYKDTLDIKYVYQGQELDAADNEAFTTLTYRTTGFLVARYGVPYDQVWAIGDVVDSIGIQCGQQSKSAPEANSVMWVGQKIAVASPGVTRDVAVVA